MEVARNVLFRFAAVLSGGDVGIPQVDVKSGADGTIDVIMKIVFGIAGGIALIMVVLGGLRYINSLGNADNVAKAKDTILYALIGLVVVIISYSIVGFVVKRVG